MFGTTKVEGIAFDKAVHNAIATLWVAGHQDGKNFNEYLTPRIIFQILSGSINESREIGPEIRKAILRSIDKMRNTEITIDNSEEAQKLGTRKSNTKQVSSLQNVLKVSVSMVMK